MRELFENCKELILDNYKGNLEDITLETMAIAVMALCLRNERRTLDKLPTILQSIEIFAENDSVLNIAKRNIPSFNDKTIDANVGACVIRGLGKDGKTGNIYEDKCLVISTENLNKNPSDIIMKLTHELTHLLRDHKFESDGKSIKTRNGISVVRINDIATGERKVKHFFFEEGIVQRYTNQSLTMLLEFIKNENVSDLRLLSRFKVDYPHKVNSAYELQVQVIDALCMDKEFDRLIDASFDEECSPASLITYFNNKMGDSTAFSSLSKDVDYCFMELISGSRETTEKYFKSSLTKAADFIRRGKIKKLIIND